MLAAAGPDSLVLHSTDAVRSAFSREGSGNVDDLEPRKRTAIPRISHLAFSSDENALVIAAEEGGGLAVYDVNAAERASEWLSDFQISTNGVAVRHLLPNPNKDSSHLFAVVLADGKLLVADLKSRNLIQTVSGSSVLRENVSCASWSKLGKQIVAGLADGSAIQMDIYGNEKDKIPKPPSVDQQPVTAIYWLENPDFLLIHAPLSGQSDDQDSMLPVSDAIYHLVHRDKETKACSFHRFSVDPCPPFLDERFPAHHFIQRIREWQPNLDDTLIVSCTASTDIGVLTRSKVALSQDLAADQITHTYTTTSFTDTRRAALPMSTDGMGDTYPIGMALDLSSKEKVPKPIPNDETIDESSIPLPQLCVLNQEGLLSSWWFVYNEAVRQNKPAPGLTASGTSSNSQPTAQQTSNVLSNVPSPFGSAPAQPTQSKPAFGQPSIPAFGSTSSFGQTNTPAFGQASTPAFGKPSFGAPSTTAFGGASSLGQKASPWASNNASTTSAAPSFGKSSFGAPSQLGASTGSAFGQVGGMGQNKASPWGSQQTNTTSNDSQPTSAFGSNSSANSPFAAFSNNADNKDKPSPFAGFAQNKAGTSPFASFSSQPTKPSPFASASQTKPGLPNETSFGSTVTLSSNTGSFGSGNTFGTPSVFGKTSETKEATMNDDDDDDDAATVRDENKVPSGLGKPSDFKLGSTFKGDGTAKDDLPKPKDVNASLFGFGLGDVIGTPAKKDASEVKIKPKPEDEPAVKLKDIPEAKESSPEAAPLPPDFINTPSKAVQEKAEEAPLPPDFIKTPSKSIQNSAEEAPLPPDFLPTPAKSHVKADAPVSSIEDSGDSKAKQNGQDVKLPEEQAGEDGSFEEFSGSEQDELSDEEEIEEGEDAENEWESEDAEEDIATDDDENQSPVIVNPKKLSAFESRITPASPKADVTADQSTTPETVQKPTFTPAGFPKAPLHFEPPRKVEESPRSPSPVRAVTTPLPFSKASTGTRPVTNAERIQVSQKSFPASSSQKSLFPEPPPPAEPETLEDESYLRIKEILEAPVEPGTTLPDFIAYQNYNGGSEKPGVAGQLEKVYRDVNSMIDTLGLNARALQAFITGHSTMSSELGEDDLGEPDAWHLGQISTLSQVQTSVGDRLDRGRLTDMGSKINDVMEQEEDMSRAIARTNELRKQLSRRTDAQQKAQNQASPLPAETAAQQTELRQSLQHVQKLLSQVEQNMTLLRADLASISAATSSDANSSSGVPTVEAVTNTILKMTSMIEQKSGDVDVLEAQIRRLPGGIASLGMSANYEDGLVKSLEGSSLSNGLRTPPSKHHRLNALSNGGDSALGMSGMFGSASLRTPPSAAGSNAFQKSRLFDPLSSTGSMLGRSTSSLPGSATRRKKIADVSVDDVENWKARTTHRRKVLAALKQAVESSSVKDQVVDVSRI